MDAMNAAMDGARLQPAIRGKIADSLNYPVASARIRLCGSRLGAKRSTLTGCAGSFMFNRVPPGVYTLEVDCSGFGKLVQRGIAVQEHSITGLDLKMDFKEDTRTLKLRALSLEYVNDLNGRVVDNEPEPPSRCLGDVVAELSLGKALFNPPATMRVGRRLTVELGIYQNVKEAITQRLLERKADLSGCVSIQVALCADLQAAGCLVLPKSLPRVEIDGARYVDWRWEILPQVAGRGLIRLGLRAQVAVTGLGGWEKCLLALDRNVLIRKSRLLSLQRTLKKITGGEALFGHSDR